MTTIERAKKFFKRLKQWRGRPTPTYEVFKVEIDYYECQSRVARALIRQEMRRWKNAGNRAAIQHCLDILDAVYGREE